MRLLKQVNHLNFNEMEKKVMISPVAEMPRTERLVRRPEAFKGDPDDLLNMNWENEVKLYIP